METLESTKTATNQSFNELYAKYYSKVLNFVMFRISGKREIAEELTNDTFVKVYNNIHKFNSDKSAFQTWVLNIAKNTIIDFYRADKSSRMVDSEEFETIEFTDASQKADSTVDSQEQYAQIDRAMEVLSKKEKNIAELYFIQQKQYKEICSILDLPLNTVKVNINRIRKKLQSKLKKSYQM